MSQTAPVLDSSSLILEQSLEGKDVGSPLIPQGGGHPSDATPLPLQNAVGCRERIISSITMLEKCRNLLVNPMSYLWGLHIRSSSVTLLIGETSAGKTVFLHNLVYHLATGQEFLGLAPPRPLRVLYVDFESNDEILGEHLSVIGAAEGWDFFDRDGVDPGTTLMAELHAAVRAGQYDVVIIDPLMEAYSVKDENDNAEANKQMVAFRDLARSTGTGVVVVHNSGLRKGKKKASEKFLGRGATSRVDRADISINFTVESSNERLLHVTKSRSRNLGEKISFRFADDLGYELVASSGPNQTVIAGVQVETLDLVKREKSDGRTPVERKTLMEKLGIEKGSAKEQALDRALRQHVVTGDLIKPRKGAYDLPDAQSEELRNAA